MKFSKNLNFAMILRNKKIDNEITDAVKKAFEINKKIFKKNPKKFKIIICDTEKEFKKEAKYYYQRWGTGTVLRNNNLIMRSPDFIEKIGKWKKKDFKNIMNHEMNHVFWTDFYSITKPCWLLEGLACYVGNHFILKKKELKKIIQKHEIDYSIIDYRYLERNFKAGHMPRYPIWCAFTKYIIKKNSIKKLIILMEKYSKNPTKQNYNKLFKNLFKKSEKQLFKEFLNESMLP